MDINERLRDEYDSEIDKLLNPINNDEKEEKEKSIFLNQYLALFFMCSSVFGQNFIIDNPAALQDYMTESLQITNSQFSSFYAYYGWSNIV
jgi:hypothetical protein